MFPSICLDSSKNTIAFISIPALKDLTGKDIPCDLQVEYKIRVTTTTKEYTKTLNAYLATKQIKVNEPLQNFRS